jgi:hypothetical protein
MLLIFNTIEGVWVNKYIISIFLCSYSLRAHIFFGKITFLCKILLSRPEKLYLGNSNIAYSLSEDGIVDEGNMRETNFLAWTRQVCKPIFSKISDFEIDGITFEVGGKNKKGGQIKDAQIGYNVPLSLDRSKSILSQFCV